MKSLQRFFFLSAIAIALAFTAITTNSFAYDVTIDVSPNVLNIQSKSVIVTVHTDVAYGLVVGSSVFLNDVAISHWKADDRGNFVAKFSSDEVKSLDGLIIGNYNTLVMTGYLTNGEAFIGSQDILVIDVTEMKGKK